jgi:CHAT domain-containing protein/tetratricopeptide (TPR) repeat protein
MKTDLAAIRQRLLRVDSALIPADQIVGAYQRGASIVMDSPRDLMQQAIYAARQNSILATASGAGAVELLDTTAAPLSVVVANFSLAAGLILWGYHYEALSYLINARKVCAASCNDPLIAAYLDWHWLMCRRRFYKTPDVFGRLLKIADALAQYGDPHAAALCRIDAVSSSAASIDVIKTIDMAVDYFRHHECEVNYGIALIIQAHYLITGGKLDAGCEAIDRAERICLQHGMPSMLAQSWYLRGVYYYQRRQPVEAAQWFEQAAARAQAICHDYYCGMSVHMLALIQHEQGKLNESFANSRRSSKIGRQLRMLFLQADSDLAMGHVLLRWGKYAQARHLYERARLFFSSIERTDLVALCDMNLGAVARRKGDFGLSLKLMEAAVARFTDNGNYENLVMAYDSLASTYGAFGYLEPAIENAEKSINLLKEVGAKGQMTRSAIYLARLLVQCGRLHEADAHLDFAAHEAKKAELYFDEALCWQVRGHAFFAAKHYQNARDAFHLSRVQFDRMDQPDGAWESQIGVVETAIALKDLEVAGTELDNLNCRALPAGLRWRHDAASARMAELENRPARAIRLYLSALQHMRHTRITLERETQIEQFVRDLAPLYEDGFRLAVKQKKPAEALAIAELYGSQLLSVRAGNAAPRIKSPRDITANVRRLISEKLGNHWTVLRYAWLPDGLWCFEITPQQFVSHRIESSTTLLSDLKAAARPDISFRQFTYSGHIHYQGSALERSIRVRRHLFNALIPDSVRSLDNEDHTLLIIPSGQLYGLAFQALLDGDTPLIEKAVILYAPSLEFLQGQLQTGVFDQNAVDDAGLLCGISDFANTEFGQLPHIRAELSTLSHNLRDTSLILENEFSRASMQTLNESGELTRYRWLHFATHTFSDSATGVVTGLVTSDGVISLRDIASWELNAEVVTLSACQTGHGKWYYGDEIAGLTQAFLGSGVRSVIASLWSANDEHTGAFMTDLYQALRAGCRPALALARAQREAHHAGLEAYLWAPFCAFGQP